MAHPTHKPCGPLLGETFDRYRITATALGFIGVLVIVQPAGGYSGWEGPALALGSAIGFALSMITIRKLSTTESTHRSLSTTPRSQRS